MQIDFHHGVTYIVARLAGFDHDEANIIAYCAQYVDDASNSGLIRFNNGALFRRMSSAHKLLDYRNFKQLASHHVWIPFHFLPGNGGLPAGQNPEGKFIQKLICYPNSYVAQEMLRECINNRDHPHGLHRLGITMHVYGDTWAHQGFAGVTHQVNEAKLILDDRGNPDLIKTEKINKYFRKNLLERMANAFMSEAFPIGHGAVLGNPDKPYLKWGYINGFNQIIKRDNAKDFLEAAEQMYKWMQRYRLGDTQADVPGLPVRDKKLIADKLENIIDKSGKKRHRVWLNSILEGEFSFGKAEVTYVAKGKGSWKYEALKTEKEKDESGEIYSYDANFLNSNWKLFHDALFSHHFYIIHVLLPKYGICIV
ncbi:conserved hypothetical protein [Gloeothece citriformis PCC 7424]|uniref:Uncharacterized protein n=1 Tax=Gloeothece citriformis (strain PCC 7424) TaxID=65393 RepID=B7K9I6_GLOC7|nr:DUF6765 family protein [Gloeothece citriformis]ACK69954.1 conserved hypothetical protein [Gloeothece citriformis PCC 7424]